MAMMYVILNDQGKAGGKKYTAVPGSEHSYTRDIRKAQTFWREEDAKHGACGNEVVVSVESQLQRPEGW